MTDIELLQLENDTLKKENFALHINRSSFGNAHFEFTASIGDFYKLYFKAYLIGLLAMLGFGLLAAGAIFVPVIGVVIVLLAYLLAGAAVLGYLRSRVGNLVFHATTLAGEARFGSTLLATGLAKLYFFNLLAITLSAGLLVPWAAIRVARYRADCLALYTPGDLDAFVGQIGQEVAATGEEIGEFFDVDFSL